MLLSQASATHSALCLSVPSAAFATSPQTLFLLHCHHHYLACTLLLLLLLLMLQLTAVPHPLAPPLPDLHIVRAVAHIPAKFQLSARRRRDHVEEVSAVAKAVAMAGHHPDHR